MHWTELLNLGVVAAALLIVLWRAVSSKKKEEREKKLFEQGYEDGVFLIKEQGFDAVDNASRKLDGAYGKGVVKALKDMEGKTWHRTLKKR